MKPIKECELPKDMVKLLNETFGRAGMEGWRKGVYKGTNCGAHIYFPTHKSIMLGSIVEGCDEGAETVELFWPFTSEDIWATLTIIEEDCERIWNQTHGCPACFGFDDNELSPINPDCLECEGEGIII